MINFTMTMYYPLMMYNIHKTLIDEHIDDLIDYEMTDLSEQFEKMGIATIYVNKNCVKNISFF